MLISGRARLAAVIGDPVAHSLSPRLHGYWLARYGIDGAYVPLRVPATELAAVFDLLPKLGFRGWNVTLPHKEAALRLVDEPDPVARRIGAVNTVLVGEGGRLRGLNTDGFGFLAGLRERAPELPLGRGVTVILGAGGAARAVAAAICEAGGRRLRIVNRTAERAARLAVWLRDHFPAVVETVSWEERHVALSDAVLCVNCTSLGMEGRGELELSLNRLPVSAVVADIVYVPLETPLLRAARERGHTVVDGLGMLLWQAVPGFRHWGGVDPTVDAGLRECLLEALRGGGSGRDR